MKATISENSIAEERRRESAACTAPSAADECHGKVAAITAQLASMVGLPTSSTASTATSARSRPWFSGTRVPDDVLHHDDGVVHQYPDGKNQGEQRDAIQRVAVEIKNSR